MELPEITKRQIWCCENGCGECRPVQIDFEYSRTKDMHGNLIESKTEKVWASHCCKAELLLWDEDKEDVIEWQPITVIPQELVLPEGYGEFDTEFRSSESSVCAEAIRAGRR